RLCCDHAVWHRGGGDDIGRTRRRAGRCRAGDGGGRRAICRAVRLRRRGAAHARAGRRPDGAMAAPVVSRHPPWLKVRAPGGPGFAETRAAVKELGLHTVCEEARCPNVAECWDHKTATFMLLGDTCTRNCRFCAVTHGRPLAVDPDEPE